MPKLLFASHAGGTSQQVSRSTLCGGCTGSCWEWESCCVELGGIWQGKVVAEKFLLYLFALQEKGCKG